MNSPRSLLLAILLLFLYSSHGQDMPERDNGISFHLSWIGDKYDEITLAQLTSRSNEYQQNAVNLDGYNVSYSYQQVTSGLVGLSYSQRTLNGKYEMRGGVNVAFTREPMVEYAINSFQDPDYHSIVFCIIENEVNLNLAFMRNFKIGDRFEMLIGPDLSMGTTFNDQFVLIEEQATGVLDEWGYAEIRYRDTYYSAESSKFHRLGINSGLVYDLKKGFKVSLEGVLGRGTQVLRNYRQQDFSFARITSSIAYRF